MRTITNELEDVFLAGWNLMLGTFLVIAPWYLGDMGKALPTWNAWVCGGAVVVLSLLALGQAYDWLEYTIATVGLWLCVAPWILAFGDLVAFTWTHVGFGLALMVSAAAELWRLRQAPGSRAV